jgi:methionine-rich copper-binding protein CopC
MTRMRLAGLLLALMISLPAGAHTALDSSSPASGSILASSPERITLNFIEPTRLVSVTLATAGESRRLTFEPGGSSTTFTIAAPALASGRNEVQWRALSQDGHVVEGSLILVVRPSR